MEAVTREEMFLAAAAGQDVDTPTPVTRREMFLQQVANNAGSRYFENVGGGDTITWDGSTAGRVSAGGLFYKISDAVPTMEDFAGGGKMSFCAPGEVLAEGTFSGGEIIQPFEGALLLGEGYVVVVSEIAVGVDLEGLCFPQAGTYFLKDGEMFAGYLTIPGYTGFETVKLKEELLPELVTYVTVTEGEDGTFSADKTFGEIMGLIQNEKTVVLRSSLSGEAMYYFYLAAFTETFVVFCVPGAAAVMQFTIGESGIEYRDE